MAKTRKETVLRHRLAAVLLDHPQGVDPDRGYDLVRSGTSMPTDWQAPIPLGPVYNTLKSHGINWRTLSAPELESWGAEPHWKNSLRRVVQHFRTAGWMDPDRGTWRLSESGRIGARALNPKELSLSERAILVPPSRRSP